MFGIKQTRNYFSSSRQNQAERLNRSINSYLSKCLQNQSDWPWLLMWIENCYDPSRSAAHPLTQFEAHYGRQIDTPTSVLLQGSEESSKNYGQVVTQMIDNCRRANEIVREALKRSAEYNKKRYNYLKRPPIFESNQKVLVLSPRIKRGQYRKWT